MVSYHKGDLLQSSCDIICHQVNLQGVMGGGLAKQIATQYPNVEKQYKALYRIYGGGMVDFCEIPSTNRYIANCFSQELNFDTNYNWVKRCFEIILKFAKISNSKTIGVPFKYGCGIANGNWFIIDQIFKDIFEQEKDIDFQIWEYKGV